MPCAGSASARSALAGAVALLVAALLILLFPLDTAAQSAAALERYRQGTRALEERRFEDARAALLEAVALDPSFAGAWLDLAVAAYGAGDAPQAEEFLDILEARFTLPPGVAAAVAALRARLQQDLAAATVPEGWSVRGFTQLGAGYDSNVNAGLAVSALTLTLPGGSVLLPVLPQLQPRPDGFALGTFAVAAARPAGGGELEFSASVRAQQNFTETEFNALETRAGVAWAIPSAPPGYRLGGLLPGPWRFSAVVQQVRWGGEALVNGLLLGAEHLWPVAPCVPRAGVEVGSLGYPAARSLDATFFWLGGRLRCPSPFGAAATHLGAHVRIGYAAARHGPGSPEARPGGDTRFLEFGASNEWAWASAGRPRTLQAQVIWNRALDTEGYSPLLSDNARRAVDRMAVGAAYSVPISTPGDAGWLAVLGAQYFRQTSNLGPFNLSGTLVQVSVQREW